MYTHVKDYPMYVGGEWTGGEARMEATSPATGETIGTVPEGTREDVRRAIAAANDAWREWAALSAFDRAVAMERVAGIIEERREELAHTLTLDQGKPLKAEAYDEVDELVEYFDMAGGDAKRLEGAMPPSVDAGKRVLLYRVPRGVVGVITPWNWPYTMPAEAIAPALACGNAVVWTPAPTTSVCAVKLAECIVDAGLPPGVFNMVTGYGVVVGDEVAANPGTQAVAFIGSVATGQKVAGRAAGKAIILEMGGNGPMVILEDANLQAAADASLLSAFLCAGQSCTAGERFLVHEKVYDAFLDELNAAIERGIQLGNPFDSETTLGPLNNEQTARKMDRHVADALERGAELVGGGARAEGLPNPALLPAHRDRRGDRGDGGRARGVLRSSRTHNDHPGRGGGASSHQLLTLRVAHRRLDARSHTRSSLRRVGARRLGQHQCFLQPLGEPPALRRWCRFAVGRGARRRPLLNGDLYGAQDDNNDPVLVSTCTTAGMSSGKSSVLLPPRSLGHRTVGGFVTS
jgi:acyl-CoA reductase-like NAD-dependent aldehyde dehydrogenase